jgi:hypothetical protein
VRLRVPSYFNWTLQCQAKQSRNPQTDLTADTYNPMHTHTIAAAYQPTAFPQHAAPPWLHTFQKAMPYATFYARDKCAEVKTQP